MLVVLKVESNIGREGKNVWPLMAVVFLRPSQPHIQVNHLSKIPKEFSPEHHKLSLEVLRVASNIGRLGKTFMVGVGHGFLG